MYILSRIAYVQIRDMYISEISFRDIMNLIRDIMNSICDITNWIHDITKSIRDMYIIIKNSNYTYREFRIK